MTVTFCLADFDIPSHYSSAFLMRYIAPRVEPFQLYGPVARRFFFDLTAPFSDIIVGTGHGNPDEYTAQNESLIWKVGEYNTRQVQGKVIKLLSCQSGKILGPDLVRNGARCFMGFSDDFVWIADPAYSLYPWQDENARACLMPVVDSLNALLDGRTCGEAFQIERAGLWRNAQKADFPLLRSCLLMDYDNAVLYGDPQATIRPRLGFILPPIPVFPLFNHGGT